MILPGTGGFARLRESLVPPLSGRIWRLLCGYAVAMAGTGFMVPFLIIYLHRVRGLDLATAGAVLATSSLAGLVVASAGGLIDRFGPARFLACALVVGAIGSVTFILVDGVAGAFGAALMYGAGTSSVQTSVSTLLARIVPKQHRSDAFGLSYAFVNLGFGAGATFGGIVLNVHSKTTFTVVFFCAAAFLFAFSLQLVLTGETSGRELRAQTVAHAPHGVRTRTPSAMRLVLADHRLLALTGLNTLFITFGFSQLASAFPAWATGHAHQDTSVVGLAFTANTFTIVFAQLFILRLVHGRSRLRTAAAAGITFALTWIVVLTAGEMRAGFLTTAGLIAALGLFGLGETLLAPSLPTAVNDLAPDSVRGRYNAVFFLSWPLGSVIGPLISGIVLDRGLGAQLIVGLMVACLLGSVLALRLEPMFVPAPRAVT